MSEEPPRPEDIHREIEQLMQSKFGDRVRLMGVSDVPIPPQDVRESSTEPKTSANLEFSMTPKEMKSQLDRFVIRQDEAKKALAIAVCDHYNHARQDLRDQARQEELQGLSKVKTGKIETEYAKQNILLIGPTGVGKTYLIKQIAKQVGVPFVKADATRFTEMGFMGANVDDLIRDLVQQANGDLELAQYGIVYLDEADKLATQSSHYGRDIGGRGVQTSLLKIMEETEVDLRASHDMASQIQSFMEFQKKGHLQPQMINTKHILFIASGAFSGLSDIVKRRLGGRTLGIGNSFIGEKDQELLQAVTTDDLIQFGFEPEFVGRLPVRVSCDSLEEDDFVQILKRSEGSILKQYRRSFAAYGIEAIFTDDGIRAIAKKAAVEKTGARSLLTVCERILREYKYELPSSSIKKLMVDEDLVEDPIGRLRSLMGQIRDL